MIDRSRKIRFRKKKSSKGWFILIILVAAVLIGAKYFWPTSITPAGPANGQTPTEAKSETTISEVQSPGNEVSVRLVLEKVLGLWAAALASGNYSQFHDILSHDWQQQDTPQKLAQVYGPLSDHRDLTEFFPRRGKLVVLESGPLANPENSPIRIRDTLGPESPWLVRGEWRTGRSALGFDLTLVWESNQWRPAGLRVEVFKPEIRNN